MKGRQMKVINSKLHVEMSLEEVEVITKMIGPTSVDSRKKDFDLTEKQTRLAEEIYDTLSNVIEEINDD